MIKRFFDNEVLEKNLDARDSNNKIRSFYALRGLAFLGIFFRHAYLDISWAELGVSMFFVLSGFLSIQFSNHTTPPSFVNNIRYMVKKAKKLYLLHIITMILTVVFIRTNAENICWECEAIQVVLNVFLIQSWIPYSDVNTSINGVAWFFSTLLFLYFIFPYIKKWLNNQERRVIILIPVIAITLQYLLCAIAVFFWGENSRTYVWFMYCFPIFRLGDYIVGGCVGKLCERKNKRNYDMSKRPFEEIVLLALTVCCLYLIKRLVNTESFVVSVLCNWTTPYIPIATIWLLFFYSRQESLTKMMNNRILRFLGILSPYLFLIHYFIIRLNYSFLIDNGITGWGNALINLVVSVVLSCVYVRVVNPKSWYLLLCEMRNDRH